jgi:hypothetical protein
MSPPTESFRTPFAKSYVINEEVPFREKQLRAAMRVRGIGRLTIKKRGIAITPEELAQTTGAQGRQRGHACAHPGASGQGTALLVAPF